MPYLAKKTHLATTTPAEKRKLMPNNRSPYHEPFSSYHYASDSETRRDDPELKERPVESAKAPILTNRNPVPLPAQESQANLANSNMPKAVEAKRQLWKSTESSSEDEGPQSRHSRESSDSESSISKEEAANTLYQLDGAGNDSESEEANESDHISTVSSDPPSLISPRGSFTTAHNSILSKHDEGARTKRGTLFDMSGSPKTTHHSEVRIDEMSDNESDEGGESQEKKFRPFFIGKGSNHFSPIELDLDSSIADM
jgi:hypothetical protein